MRRIDPHDFRIATRSTSRDINRRIALNLVREHQPISRADLARRMKVRRGIISVLVTELISEGLIYEGVTGETARGRKPIFLHVKTQDRLVIAIDVRLSCTYIGMIDFGGQQRALETFPTVGSPTKLIEDLADRVQRLLRTQDAASYCKGIGLVVPGIVNHSNGRIVVAPALGWRDVDVREGLSAATGLPVHVENAAKACALAQMWLGNREGVRTPHTFAYLSVSDGVGVGLVINGELVRGRNDTAGEFGHTPLSLDGPPCVCGATGCWETYISNVATLSRYFGRNLPASGSKAASRTDETSFTIVDLISRARSGDGRAAEALRATGRYLGLGLATVINSLNPECVYVGGEITSAWDLIEGNVRDALVERAITDATARTPVQIVATVEHPRLRGAAALVAAPTFAAPRVA
jgi:N-acetylglucosamine repressor